MRGAFAPVGHEFLDELFAELLVRGSRDIVVDIARLNGELAGDPILATALRDEYIAAYAAAVATVRQSVRPHAPVAVWAAATSLNSSTVAKLAKTLQAYDAGRAALIKAAQAMGLQPVGTRPLPPLHAVATKSELREQGINTGLLLAVDHDVVWANVDRRDAELMISRKLSPKGESVASLVRRHRSREPSLGIQTAASRNGRKWLKRVRGTVWFERLRPLHPPMLTERNINKIKAILVCARALLAVPKATGASRSPRNSRPCPRKRVLVDGLLSDDMWALVESAMPQGGPRSKPARDVLLAALIVLHYGIGWTQLPSTLGFGSGQRVLERVRRWRETGAWSRVQVLLGPYFPGLEWSRDR
jgi:hypothetical protein